MSTQITLSKLITPITEEGIPDQRHLVSLKRILQEIGEDTAKNLLQFAESTALLQRRAADDGLRLAIAIFNEAEYLERNHRFDEDNKYGWQSKRLRKQAQRMLESVGFKRNNAHKLATTADWLANRYTNNDEQKWFDTLTPSHLYELSRMSPEAFKATQEEVSYGNFMFCAGQQSITVRRLGERRQQFPKSEVTEEIQEPTKISTSSGPKENQGLNTTASELVEQFVSLVKAIDWSSLQQETIAMESLGAIEYTLTQICELVDQWKYAPVTLTSQDEQLEMRLPLHN